MVLIEINCKNIQLETVNDRSSDILKTIILHHVGYINTIISDGWKCYFWLNDYGNNNHIVYMQGRNDFGHGSISQPYRVDMGNIKRNDY